MGELKKALILIALALLVCFVVFGSRQDASWVASVSDAPGDLTFEVRVVKPRSSRPLFGLLPDGAFGLPPNELHFDSGSPGAAVVCVEADRLELRADGWELLIAIDGEGRIAPETRVVFPIELADKPWNLRCRPAPQASGFLRTTARSGAGDGADELDGSFLVEFATCEKAETGKVIDWPSAALVVRGSFRALARGRR